LSAAVFTKSSGGETAAFHPEAAEEYADAANYYTRIYPELGGRFFDEMEQII
jgi:hypothetical protein